MELGWAAILLRIALRLWPVWLALALSFGAARAFRHRLGFLGRLLDSRTGMTGLALVLFWTFAALLAPLIVTHDPLAQLSGMRNAVPGTPLPDPQGGGYPHYLLGGDALARDVFSRMIAGARAVLAIAPAAALVAYMTGISLGLPAGYYRGRIDAGLTFAANLVIAFPGILLFFLLVTPEIRQTPIPRAMSAILFAIPLAFAAQLIRTRHVANRTRRRALLALTLALGVWAWSGLVLDADPLGLWRMPPNLLNIFIAVVFVSAPVVFRITRGLTLDLASRDYVAAARTRGETPAYIMLWEILPNARGPLIVDFCLRIGYITILLGALGFFGLGVSPESPDWGSTINQGRRLLTAYPHAALAPALALMSLVLGLNLLADGLREESLRD
ncbi:ABC transporter permease subunit [Paracoccus sp. S-4012]|nr:ABC transporter permease subunit [Paracoccus sp. S-4012]